jgi:hypothetical protein
MSPTNVYAPPVIPTAGPQAGAPLTCPRCGAAVRADSEAQKCGRCSKWFSLVAGPAMDGNVIVPPFDPSNRTYGVRWSVVFTYKYGALDPMGISEGMLDPVIGVQSISHAGVAYPDIVSIAIWRKLDWVAIVVAVLFLPVALGCLAAALAKVWGLAIFGVGLGAAVAYLGYRGIVVGRCYARVVGRYAAVTVRFDQPASKRRAFHDELFRRAGLRAPQLP